jgi:hypothetical protein
MAFDVTEVQGYLKGIEYPASREDVASQAEDNGAPDDLVSALRDLDDEEFEGPNEVMAGMKGALGGDGDS